MRVDFSKPLLILDLDETLFHASENPLGRAPDFKVGGFSAYRRPYLENFLKFANVFYSLAVWTSATSDYARAVVENLFQDEYELNFVWSRERCTQGYNANTLEHHWVKDLKKLRRRGFALAKTVVLDDSPEKLERNYGNLLRVKPYFGDEADAELLEVQPFLKYLSQQENIRNIEKRHWRGFGNQLDPV